MSNDLRRFEEVYCEINGWESPLAIQNRLEREQLFEQILELGNRAIAENANKLLVLPYMVMSPTWIEIEINLPYMDLAA